MNTHLAFLGILSFFKFLNICFCFNFPLGSSRININDPCETSNGKSGTCVRARECFENIGRLNRDDICFFEGNEPVTCCFKEQENFDNINKICENNYPEKGGYGLAGGVSALYGEHPHMAAIGWQNEFDIQWNCGGSLIDRNIILTAAHCTSNGGVPPNIVRLGTVNLDEPENETLALDYKITKITVHPGYKRELYYHDIAILQIEPITDDDEDIKPICLWTEPEPPTDTLLAMGFGTTAFGGIKSNTLYQGNLTYVHINDCKQLFTSSNQIPNGLIDSQMCALDSNKVIDTCQGDSGGPLQFRTEKKRPYLVGITSFGEYCVSGKPGVYTKIHSYLGWILQNM